MKQLSLDTKGVCFLCLDTISNDEDTSFPSRVKGFCLRSICSFLKVDQRSVLLKSLHDDDDKVCPSSSAYNFSVTLCQACHKMSSKLASMIIELEKLKMLLDHQIISFHETVSKSQSKGSVYTVCTAENVHKSFDGLSLRQMEMEAKLIDDLRLETDAKCRIFIKNQVKKSPLVVLHRLDDHQTHKRKLAELQTINELFPPVPLDVKKTRITLPEPVEVTKNISEENSEEKVEIRKEISEDGEIQSIGLPACSPGEAAKPKSTTTINTESKLRNEIISKKTSLEPRQQSLELSDESKNMEIGQVYQCPFCEVSFQRSSTTDFDVHLHLTNLHPDKLFASKKSPQINDANFKQLCLNLLLSEVKNTSRLNRHLLPTLYSCLYCTHVVEKAQSIKCHYVKCHYEIMSGKLVTLQNQISIQHQQEAVMQYETRSTSSSVILSIQPVPPPQGPPKPLPISFMQPVSSNQSSNVSKHSNSSIPLSLPHEYLQLPVSQKYSQPTAVQVPALPPIQPLPPFNTICNTRNRYNYNGHNNAIMENRSNQVHHYHQTNHNNRMMNYYYKNVIATNHHHPHQHQNSNVTQNQLHKSTIICGADAINPQNALTELVPSSSSSINSIQRQIDSLNKHTVQHDLEADILSENIDLEKFMETHKLFLQREVDLCTKTIPEESGKVINHCPYCPETFYYKPTLRAHLCQQHYHIMRQKIYKING